MFWRRCHSTHIQISTKFSVINCTSSVLTDVAKHQWDSNLSLLASSIGYFGTKIGSEGCARLAGVRSGCGPAPGLGKKDTESNILTTKPGFYFGPFLIRLLIFIEALCYRSGAIVWHQPITGNRTRSLGPIHIPQCQLCS